MIVAQSKLTSQGQISVPSEVRRRLGIGPGSVLEWDLSDESDTFTVRRSTKYTTEDLHRALFPEGPPPRKTLAELKEGIADHMRERYGKR
jgi:AbrB family looped-hinge helix DNA binding protein